MAAASFGCSGVDQRPLSGPLKGDATPVPATRTPASAGTQAAEPPKTAQVAQSDAERRTQARAERRERATGEVAAQGVWLAACPAATHERAARAACTQLVALRDACRAGEGQQCAALAACFFGGFGVAKDPARARVLFAQACRLKDARGCRQANETVAACRLKDPQSCATVAAQRLDSGTAAQRERAFHALTVACKDGVAQACVHVGSRLWQAAETALQQYSDRGRQNAVASIEAFLLGCRQCHAGACAAAAATIEGAAKIGVLPKTELLRLQPKVDELARRACLLGHRPACEP